MELLVKEDNYITIQGFMRTRLGLSGNELNAFAIVYGFSQAPDTEFTGGLQYIADWCGCSYRTAVTTMQSLTDKGLVIKTDIIENGVKFCSYRAVCKNFTGCEKISHGGSEKISHNNIVNNKLGKETNKESSTLVDSISEYISSEKVSSAVKTWLDYKKERKDKKYTERGFRMLLGDLRKDMEQYGEQYVIDEINNSIKKGYMGIYPNKEYGKPQKQEFMRHNYTDEQRRKLFETVETPLEDMF